MKPLDRIEDELLAQEIREVLTWDARVDAANVRIDVARGIVTLSGGVRQAAELNVLSEDAWSVKGVREVINDVSVAETSERSDAQIAADVVRSLASHDPIALRYVVVQVAGGVVTLSGVVSSESLARAAEASAWNVDGVAAVTNVIAVSPNHLRPDPEIEADVYRSIVRDSRILDATRVSVSVINGVAVLRGEVATPTERCAMAEDARFTAGVRQVVDEIVINSRGENTP